MKILIGDILQSKTQTIVNTVNCVGIMGKGIALEFKNKFPDMYEDYLQRCQRGEVRPGIPYLYRSLLPPQIINFPTKDHWKSVSKISDIARGLEYLTKHYQEWGIT
ncbi:MAG TPA: macro domain-containing protein, partial [Opitutaceae bacterium]|nr:macro domain-containing protein [Opitutaceae bacterium]